MIGVKRAVNPQLQMAGDGTGKADLTSLETLLRENPDNKFLVTLLSRENQHELCVIGRKFQEPDDLRVLVVYEQSEYY